MNGDKCDGCFSPERYTRTLHRTHHGAKPMLAVSARIDIVCAPDKGLAGKLKSEFPRRLQPFAGRMKLL